MVSAQFVTQTGNPMRKQPLSSLHAPSIFFFFHFLSFSVSARKWGKTVENPKLGNMDSKTMNSTCELEEMGTQKMSISDQTNGLEYTHVKSESFVVNMERFSHAIGKDFNANSGANLQRSLSRKGLQRGGEKKMNAISGNERDITGVAISSPRAALAGACILEKPTVVTVGVTDQPTNQITIMTGGGGGATTAESKFGAKRFSFRRPSYSWTIDPRRVLFFFATLSSLGSIVLIYFTLSMGKLNVGDDALN